MSLPYCKVVLIEGDVNLTIPIVSTIRKLWFPGGTDSSSWVVLEPPNNKDGDSDYCDQIDREILQTDIMGDQKVLVLRGFPNRKEFRQWIFKVVPLVEKPNTLILWDVDGIIMNSSDSEWKGLRNEIKGIGQCIEKAPPLDAKVRLSNGKYQDLYNIKEKTDYIMHSVEVKDHLISNQNATLLLSMIGADRGMIDTEITKLLFACENKVIDEKLIREAVLPLSQDYPIWQFSSAMNTGNYSEIMSSAKALLNMGKRNKEGKLDSSFKPEGVMNLALKQCRWQLMGIDLLRKGEDVHSGLRKYGSHKSDESIRKSVWSKLSYLSRERAQKNCIAMEENNKKVTQELLGHDIMIQGISDFISRLLRDCPREFTADVHAWAWRKAIERYGIAKEAMVKLRVLKPEAGEIFLGQELRRLSL